MKKKETILATISALCVFAFNFYLSFWAVSYANKIGFHNWSLFDATVGFAGIVIGLVAVVFFSIFWEGLKRILNPPKEGK